jgi:hypothetical protein
MKQTGKILCVALVEVVIAVSRLTVLALVIGTALSAAHGQTTTAHVSGTVTDSSGARIPGASVTATNIDTGLSRKTVSNDSGTYVLDILPPGRYKIIFHKPGFSVRTDENLTLTVDEGLVLNAPLALGSANEVVTVQADVQGLQTSSSELGSVIGQKAVEDLPLNGRNFTQLLLLAPGATPITTSQGAGLAGNDSETFAIPGSAYANPAINGQENRSQMYLFDGVINTDFRATAYSVLPILDSIQEFKLVSHPDDPEYGGVLGGVVNLVSRSGTNQFHGSAWEYLRNNFFDARDSFGDRTRSGPAPFHQNEFGGTFGGPVRIPKLYDGRDKTHFFFGYEGWRYLTTSNSYYFEPTDAELNGDFSNSIYTNPGTTTPQPIYDPASTTMGVDSAGHPILIRKQFVYNGVANVIPPSRIDPAIQNYFKYYLDRPNVAGVPYGNVYNGNPNINNDDSFTGRVDQIISNKDSIWARYSTQGQTIQSPQYLHVNVTTKFIAVNEGLGYTHVFSPKLLLDVRGGFTTRPFNPAWEAVDSLGNGGLTGLANNNAALGPPNLGLSFYQGADLGGVSVRKDSDANLSSDVILEHGRHTIKFGGGFYEQWRTQLQSSQDYNFGTFLTAQPQITGTPGAAASATAVAPNTGNALASALLSLPSSGAAAFESGGYKSRMLAWDAFVGDSWKATSRLTINAGLRYDHLNQPQLPFGIINGFDFENGIYYLGGGKSPSACVVNVVSPCIPGPSADVATDLAAIPGYDGSLAGSHIQVNPNPTWGPYPVWVDFGPRLGFAYRGADNTAIHGGFGILYDDESGIGQTFTNSAGNWPGTGSASPSYNQNLNGPFTTLASSQSELQLGIPSPTPFNQQGYFSDPHNKIPYSEQYNLGIDAAVKTNVASISYVGSQSHRLDYGGIANQAKVPGDLSTIPYPYMIPTPWDQNTANSNYNALQIKFNHPLQRGIEYLVSYTWSKSIDNGSGRFGAAEAGAGGGSANQEFYNPRNGRSVSSFDVPQFVSVFVLYELPFGKGKEYLNTGLSSVLLGGWQLNTISQLRSGQVYNLGVNGDIAQVGDPYDSYGRPNAVPGVNPKPKHPTWQEWYNPAAFSVPVLSFGDVGRNSMRSSHVITSDISLLKNFSYSEKVYLQFRAEAFNVMNIQNYGAPDTNISDTTAGQISGLASPPRQLQFALRLNF